MPNHSSAWFSRRSALRMTTLGAGASILTTGISCSPQGSGTRSVDEALNWAAANLPSSTADIIKGAAKEGYLTLTMLNQGGNAGILEDLISAFNKRYPFIKVAYTAQSTLQLVNKFNAELAAGKALTDYLNFPPNLKTTNTLARQGAILPFVISQDAAFPAQAKHNGFWYAWRCDYPATAYRKDALSEE